MQIRERIENSSIYGSDVPRLEGRVRIRLHNPTTGKTEIIEGHNLITNALKDIFDSNFGGIIDYDNLMPLYQKMTGGVLCFAQQLDDTDASDYSIPAAGTNAIVAHAGQTTYSDAADDLTRGNPNTTGLVLTSGSVTQEWEWASSQGNGTISAIALCHKDIGDAGATGKTSNAFKALDPFIEVGNKSRMTPSEISGAVIFAVKNNYAYSFKVTEAGILSLYKTPIIYTKTKLQGSGLVPLTDYTETTTINLGHNFSGDNACAFRYDLIAGKLYIYSVYSTGSTVTPTDLTIDTIDLSAGTATSTTTTLSLTNRYLWSFRTFVTGQGYTSIRYPYQAIVIDNYLYLPTCTEDYRPDPDGYIRANLSNLTDIDEVTNNSGETNLFYVLSGAVAVNGGKAVTTSGYMIDGTTIYKTNEHKKGDYNAALYFSGTGNIAIYDGVNLAENLNRAIISKLYLATKFNLQTPVTKTAAQSMTVTYTLTEV